jgi:hypothetical protein
MIHLLDTLLVLFWSLIIKLVAMAVYTVLLVSLVAILLFLAATFIIAVDRPRNPSQEPPSHGP